MHEVIAKSILSSQNGINIYRGCTHGCIYCDSRSKCYQMKHEFTDIEVKINAPELLNSALKKKREKCMIGTGGMTDPYLHIEKNLMLTRKVLEVIDKNGCGVAIQTKSDMILRDLDLLKRINEHSKCIVEMTLTTADDTLCKIIEPHVCPTSRRLEVLKILHDNGIETIVWLCPFLPYINDSVENLKYLLEECYKAGVKGYLYFGAGLTLREGNREYFYNELDKNFKGLKERYIREFKNNYEVYRINTGKETDAYYNKFCLAHNLMSNNDIVFAYMHEYSSHLKTLFDFA